MQVAAGETLVSIALKFGVRARRRPPAREAQAGGQGRVLNRARAVDRGVL